MNDLISRQEAIDALVERTNMEWERLRFLLPVTVKVIEELPSAEPDREVGHWIYKDGVRGFGLGAWCCSECGEENESLPFHKCRNPYEYAASKYCACCGAKMEADHE